MSARLDEPGKLDLELRQCEAILRESEPKLAAALAAGLVWRGANGDAWVQVDRVACATAVRLSVLRSMCLKRIGEIRVAKGML